MSSLVRKQPGLCQRHRMRLVCAAMTHVDLSFMYRWTNKHITMCRAFLTAHCIFNSMHTELRGAKVIYQPRQVFGKPWSLERPAVEMMSNGVRPLHPPSWYDDDDDDVMTIPYLVSTFWFDVLCCAMNVARADFYQDALNTPQTKNYSVCNDFNPASGTRRIQTWQISQAEENGRTRGSRS